MTQQEALSLASKLVNTVMADLGDRAGMLDGVDDEVIEEMRIELTEKIIDDLPFIDDGSR